MSEPQTRIELPPEAEPARDFIEALVARYEKRIHELEQQVQSLTEQLQKLTPRNSSLPPSSEHPHARPDRKSGWKISASGAARTDISGISERWFP